jgi:dUTP pyrophosphatase
MPDITVRVLVLPHGEGLALPAYATSGSAGCDLRAAITGPLTLGPGERFAIPTGIIAAIPEGFEGQVRIRSGLALKSGLVCLNAPGTIDCDYRGEIHVIAGNVGSDPITIERGERIAQLVFAPVVRATLERVQELPATARGAGGFGSTGRS